MMFTSQIGSALGFVLLGQVGCDYKSAAVVIVMTVAVNTAATTGAMVWFDLKI